MKTKKKLVFMILFVFLSVLLFAAGVIRLEEGWYENDNGTVRAMVLYDGGNNYRIAFYSVVRGSANYTYNANGKAKKNVITYSGKDGKKYTITLVSSTEILDSQTGFTLKCK